MSSETCGIFFREHEMSELFIFGNGGGSGPLAQQGFARAFPLPWLLVGVVCGAFCRFSSHLGVVKGFVS